MKVTDRLIRARDQAIRVAMDGGCMLPTACTRLCHDHGWVVSRATQLVLLAVDAALYGEDRDENVEE